MHLTVIQNSISVNIMYAALHDKHVCNPQMVIDVKDALLNYTPLPKMRALGLFKGCWQLVLVNLIHILLLENPFQLH